MPASIDSHSWGRCNLLLFLRVCKTMMFSVFIFLIVCCFVCFFFLAERPGIAGIPKNHTVTFIEREDVKINCRTTGIPIPNVTWTRSGNEAKNFAPASPLILKNISREEDGLYWCVAENGLGKVTASVRVIVKCKYYWKQ